MSNHFFSLIGFLSAVCVIVHAQNASFPDCKLGPLSKFPICDMALGAKERAADLISRMTLEEKISSLGNTAPALPRLGVPMIQWWSEALHGVALSPGVTFGGSLPFSTSFPQPIGSAASFNRTLWGAIAQVVSTEARAFSNQGQANLTYFTPNINIVRDPRWGRGQETPGEDVFLSSEYVNVYVRGLQEGADDRYLKISACCKHYAAYDLENWNGTDRFHFDAIVSDQDMAETFLPVFETCVRDAHVTQIMCSYNAVNGVPACANKFLLNDVLRQQWGFDGFVVSDCGAISVIYDTHKYAKTVQDAVAYAFIAGTDINCGSFYQQNTMFALGNNTIIESQIDQALVRAFTILVRLGIFDDASIQPYRQIPPDAVNTLESRVLSLNAALQSIVLLKNDGILPLAIQSGVKVAVIGPNANATDSMLGNYYGVPPFLISPLSAIQSLPFTVSYAPGCTIDTKDTSGFAEAIAAAQAADYVIFVGGLGQQVESEDRDRNEISLPGVQLQLIQELEKVAKHPLIVAIMGGSSVDLSYARDSNSTGGLLWFGYPGQYGGLALATVITGQYNPAGRLPITFYPADYVNQVSFFDMSMRPSSTNPGRTYKFYTGEPAFAFVFGLSYSKFQYDWKQHQVSVIDTTKLHKRNLQSKLTSFRVDVTNQGPFAGQNSVLAFVSPQIPDAPLRQLIGFERVALAVGQEAEVTFFVELKHLAYFDANGQQWIRPGVYHIGIGTPGVQVHSIEITGNPLRL